MSSHFAVPLIVALYSLRFLPRKDERCSWQFILRHGSRALAVNWKRERKTRAQERNAATRKRAFSRTSQELSHFRAVAQRTPTTADERVVNCYRGRHRKLFNAQRNVRWNGLSSSRNLTVVINVAFPRLWGNAERERGQGRGWGRAATTRAALEKFQYTSCRRSPSTAWGRRRYKPRETRSSRRREGIRKWETMRSRALLLLANRSLTMLGLFLVLPFCDWKWNIEWSVVLSRELNATRVNFRYGAF